MGLNQKITEETYALPLERAANVGNAIDQLHSALKERGYGEDSGGEKRVTYLAQRRFFAGEPTLRFTTTPPLSMEDQSYITKNVSGSIDIFVEVEED